MDLLAAVNGGSRSYENMVVMEDGVRPDLVPKLTRQREEIEGLSAVLPNMFHLGGVNRAGENK